MNFPEVAAESPQPYSDPLGFTGEIRAAHTAAPQSWMVTVADAKYHWYDLISGFQERPDIHDPVGRYLRRMQFELEAVAEKRHLFFAVIRPTVRFDVTGVVQWGFFSLKLTLPLLVGIDRNKENLTIELKVPFAATLKKPTVTLSENFVTFNWGGLVEALSIHDVLQTYAHNLRVPSKVVYVGQTRDPESRLAKGRLPAMQRIRAQFSLDYDTLLLVQRMDVEVSCATGDPADMPQNEHPLAADALHAERIDAIEAALVRYFEGANARNRNADEPEKRAERLTEIQAENHLSQYTIDLQLEDAGNYATLYSEFVPSAKRHLLSCFIADGEANVASMPIPEPVKGART